MSEIELAATKLLRRCFWHRVTVFGDEALTLLKHLHCYSIPGQLTWLFMKNILLTLQNYLDPNKKFPSDNIVQETVIIEFLEFIFTLLRKWNKQKEIIHTKGRSKSTNRQILHSMQKTIHLGTQLIQTSNAAQLLWQWATQNTEIFWPLILQPIHENRFLQTDIQIFNWDNYPRPYNGKIPDDDVFAIHDIIETQQLKMTVEDIQKLDFVLQNIARYNIRCCHNYITTLTRNHYDLCLLRTIQLSDRRTYFALNNDSPLIFALLEALKIMPSLPFDAVSPGTAHVLLNHPTFEFREPFLVFSVTDQTGNRTYEINLPVDFETLRYTWSY